jgi:hypothetical protein
MPMFSPPGRVNDLTRPADLQAWSNFLSGALDGSIPPGGQMFNPVTHPRADLVLRPIPWLAVPQTLWDHRPRDTARTLADDRNNRPDTPVGQNEYAEWFTGRDPADNEVVSVDLTTEFREYWTFLDGRLSQSELGDVYRQLYPAATDAELHPGGVYDPDNPWNDTRGAMHLRGVINTLPAALGVIAGAVPWRFNTAGRVVDVQDCGQGTFHADPSLAVNINRIAREGRAITLADPVGIYVLDVDTSGWRTPDGSDPRALLRFSRGTPPMHVRVTVPPGRAFRLCDVTIADERIRWGAQVAERVVVGTVLAVGPPGEFSFTSGQVCGGVAAPLPAPAMAGGAAPPAPSDALQAAAAVLAADEPAAMAVDPATAAHEAFVPFHRRHP